MPDLTPPPTSAKRPRLASLIGLLVLIIGGLLLFFGGIFAGFAEYMGRAHFGTEFNPTTFETRDYSYRSGAFSGIQRGSLERYSSPSPLSTLLVSKGWLPRSNSTTWHLARHDENDRLKDAIAAPLVIQLKSLEFNDFWVNWIGSNPTAAEYLWPAVIELANEGLYGDIAPLLETFEAGVDQPQATVDSYLQKVYSEAMGRERFREQADRLKQLSQQPFSQRIRPTRQPISRPPAPPDSSNPSSQLTAEPMESTNTPESLNPAENDETMTDLGTENQEATESQSANPPTGDPPVDPDVPKESSSQTDIPD